MNSPPKSSSPLYQRALVKVSGEFFSPENQSGIERDSCAELARQIGALSDLGLTLGIVAGAGNLWRGFRGEGRKFERAVSDHMGMLATMMNAFALAQSLNHIGVPTRILNPFGDHPLSERFTLGRLEHSHARREVVLFAGGTGSPFCTTDTAAALMALQMNAEVLLKATKVDGVYSADPTSLANAERFAHLTYDEALDRRIAVLDGAALMYCRDHHLMIRVFKYGPESLLRAATDSHFGSAISNVDDLTAPLRNPS